MTNAQNPHATIRLLGRRGDKVDQEIPKGIVTAQSAQVAHRDKVTRHPRNLEGHRERQEKGPNTTVPRSEDYAKSTWTPNALRSTKDLHDHIYQR